MKRAIFFCGITVSIGSVSAIVLTNGQLPNPATVVAMFYVGTFAMALTRKSVGWI